MPGRWVCVCALLLTSACTESGTLVVQVRTDLVPSDGFSAVLTTIRRVPDGAPIDIALDAGTDRAWGEGVRVAEAADLEAGEYLLSVRAVDGTSVVVERPVRVEVRAGVLFVVTVLLTRDCAGVMCPEADATATACLGGRCVQDTCTEEMTVDCAMPDCLVDSDCDPAGYDACADLRCTGSGTCFAAPDHSSCGAGRACDVMSGCRDVGTPMDAGGPDAAVADGGFDAGFDAFVCPTPCDLIAQCGCATGEACYPVGMRRGSICRSAGPVANGELCAALSDCVPGSVCASLVERPAPTCVTMCRTDAGCTGAGEVCYFNSASEIGFCVGNTCDPVAETGCGPSESCFYWAGSDSIHSVLTYQDCRAVGSLSAAATCTQHTDCDTGLHCLGAVTGSGQCVPYCNSVADCAAFDPASLCVNVAGDGPVLPHPGVCTYPCDPAYGGCGGGRGCYLFPTSLVPSDTSAHATICLPPGAGAEGAACTSTFSCGAEMLCAGGFCRQGCLRSAPMCARGSCQRTSPPILIGTREYGYCN